MEPTFTTLRLTDELIGFYEGRDGAPGGDWQREALRLGLCSYALLDSGEALVYDSHLSAERGQAIRAIVEKLGARKITLVLSHWHLDHVAGNAAFADCEIIAHVRTQTAMENHKAAIEAGTLEGAPAIHPLVLPNRVYEDQMRLQVGALEVQLRHVEAHSADGTVIYLPQERTLLAGDTLEDTVNWVAEPETLPAQIEALERMWGWDVERVFPNHGDAAVIESGGYRKTLIRAGQQYLRTLPRTRQEPEIAALPLKEFIAGPLTAGWVNYYEPYEEVHRANVARVQALTGNRAVPS